MDNVVEIKKADHDKLTEKMLLLIVSTKRAYSGPNSPAANTNIPLYIKRILRALFFIKIEKIKFPIMPRIDEVLRGREE